MFLVSRKYLHAVLRRERDFKLIHFSTSRVIITKKELGEYQRLILIPVKDLRWSLLRK